MAFCVGFTLLCVVDSGWNQVKAKMFSGENHDRGSSFAETKLDLICLAHLSFFW